MTTTALATDTPVWNLRGFTAWCVTCDQDTDHNTAGHDKRDQGE